MAAKPKPLKQPGVKRDAGKSAALPAKKPNAGRALLKAVESDVAPVQPSVPATTIKSSANATALKKKDLIDKVVATTGAQKATVREIVEATLSVLGDALSTGVMLNLPPFGKAKVSRPSDATSGKPMTVKLRRSAPGGNGGTKTKQALADAED